MHVQDRNQQLADRAAAADRLREAVDRAGGPTEIAARSGVPLGTLNGYLAGGEMKLSNAVRLAGATGVTMEWLALGRGDPLPRGRHSAVITGASDQPQAPLRPSPIDPHWLAKAIELVEALGGRDLPLRERVRRIVHSYELLTAPEADLDPLPPVPRRGS